MREKGIPRATRLGIRPRIGGFSSCSGPASCAICSCASCGRPAPTRQIRSDRGLCRCHLHGPKKGAPLSSYAPWQRQQAHGNLTASFLSLSSWPALRLVKSRSSTPPLEGPGIISRRIPRLIGDRGSDSDPLDAQLASSSASRRSRCISRGAGPARHPRRPRASAVQTPLGGGTVLCLATQLPAARHPLETPRRELPWHGAARSRPNPPQPFMRWLLGTRMEHRIVSWDQVCEKRTNFALGARQVKRAWTRRCRRLSGRSRRCDVSRNGLDIQDE